MSLDYNNDSMRTQTDREAIRTYPNVHLGTDDLAGATQTFKEILSNSVDEANSGFGKKITITIDKDNSMTVKDYGRGLPMDFNSKENQYNWEIAFCKLHGGGKFKGNRGNYNSSAGQHGIGAAATQLSSEFTNVIVHRDNFIYEMHFKKGLPDGDLIKKEETKLPQITSTSIHWKPDDEVFTDTNFNLEEIKAWVKSQAIVNAGIKFELIDKRNKFKESYYYKHGIYDYVEEMKKTPISSMITFESIGIGKDTPKRPEYEVKVNCAFIFTDVSESLYFHNSIPLEYGGSPKRAEQEAFTSFFSNALKDKIKGKLDFKDIEPLLLFVSATYTQVPPSFENQTKKAISNKFIQDFLTAELTRNLLLWSKDKPLEFEKVCQQIYINQTARTTVTAQQAIKKEKLKKSISGMQNRIPNYIGCASKNVEEKELYICLVGNTKVQLVDDVKEIKDLVGQKDIPGYSIDENGNRIIGLIKDVKETQKVHKTIKITYDDGSIVESTPEHRFMDKNMNWIEAKDLYIGQEISCKENICS